MFGRTRIRELESKLAEAERRAEINAERAEKRAAELNQLKAVLQEPSGKGGIVELFHRLYYNLGYARTGTWFATHWFGVPAWKCPFDLWVYQEMLFETRPDYVLETGTAYGGSALFFAHVFDLLGSGRVVTVDIKENPGRPKHNRITYLSGSSTSPEILGQIDHLVGDGSALVVLDSDHSRDHVLSELEAYPKFVKEGGYLVVEDTNVNGHPVLPDHGPGPMEALKEFLESEAGSVFSRDKDKEKFLLTFNPGGFLKKTGP